MCYDENSQVDQGNVATVCPWCHATIAEATLVEHVREFHRLVQSDAERLNQALLSPPDERDWLDHQFQNAAKTICPWCWGNIEDAGHTLEQHIVDFHRLTPADAKRVQEALQKKPRSKKRASK